MESLWWIRRGLELNTEPSLQPVNTAPHSEWSDGKLLRKEAWLRAQHETLYFTSQHSTIGWSDEKYVTKQNRRGLELNAEPSLQPVNTTPHSGQMESLWWMRWGSELNTEPSTEPVNTVPHGGQMELSLWQRRRGLELSMEPSISQVNTAPHDQIKSLWRMRWGFELNTEPSIEPVNTVPHGCQIKSLWPKSQGLELSTILISISPVNTAPHSGQIESLWWIRRGLELSLESALQPVNTVPHGRQSESFWGRRWSLHQTPLYMNKECQRTPTLHKQPEASTQGWFQSPEVPFLSWTSSTALSWVCSRSIKHDHNLACGMQY